MIDYKLIGARIKAAREKANITQEVLAEKADITVVYLSKIENGKVRPTLEVLHSICCFLGCDLGYVLSNVVTEVPAYQQETVNLLFQKLSPSVKPIAIELLEQLAKL